MHDLVMPLQVTRASCIKLVLTPVDRNLSIPIFAYLLRTSEIFIYSSIRHSIYFKAIIHLQTSFGYFKVFYQLF